MLRFAFACATPLAPSNPRRRSLWLLLPHQPPSPLLSLPPPQRSSHRSPSPRRRSRDHSLHDALACRSLSPSGLPRLTESQQIPVRNPSRAVFRPAAPEKNRLHIDTKTDEVEADGGDQGGCFHGRTSCRWMSGHRGICIRKHRTVSNFSSADDHEQVESAGDKEDNHRSLRCRARDIGLFLVDSCLLHGEKHC